MSHHPALRTEAAVPSRRSHEQSSPPFFQPALTSSDEPYSTKRSELSFQLYDPTSTFSSVNYNHSTRAIGHMVRLGTTAQNYGQEDYVKRNLGDWVEVFNCLGSAEQKTRQLLGDLQTLTLPRPRGSGVGAYPVNPIDVSTTSGSSSPFAGDTNPLGVGQYAALSLINASSLDGSMGGYVARREAMEGEYHVAGSARRAKQAQIIDGLLDTSSFATAGGKHLTKDDDVYNLCVEVENLAKSGIRRLHTLDSNFHKADGTWASVVSNISQSTGTLYYAVSTTAEILGGIVNGIDNGPNKMVLGGIERSLQKAAAYLQAKMEDPTGTMTTVDKARAAAEDLRHNAHMILMAYIELAAIVQEILTTRRRGRLLPDATKERIAQFFYSFGRHFDTLPGDSIQHTAQVQYNDFQSSRTGTRAGITSDFFPEFDYITQLGHAASATESHCEALVLLLCYAHEESRIIQPVQDAMRAVADCLALLAKAIRALQDVFDSIRRIIALPAGKPNDELAELSSAYLFVIYALKAVGTATDSSVEVLSSAEPAALASIAYPPVIHFFLVQVIGTQWNDRLYALAKLSHFFQRIQADIRHIGSLTVQLQLSIEGMQERFSVTKMLEYRELIPERRWQVDQFLARTLGDLEPWINYALFPEFDYIAQLGSAASTTANHCEALVRHLWYAREEAQIISPVRDSMRSIADCLARSGKVIRVLQYIFLTIRRIVSSPAGDLKDDLSELSAAYNSTLDVLKDPGSATERSVESLTKSEPEALASIAYPPVLHFSSSKSSDRSGAIVYLRHIGSLTIQLQLAIESMQQRFSVSKMLEYRELSAEQLVELDQFIGRTAVALEMRVNHIQSHERAVRKYNAPVLQDWMGGAHVRPQ
ncbi:uncharacterized protein SCHCODRAFT_01160926 [Schizophyllum commune H4-8]|nr:uncharacterized protein SCHCODRAFT_01160926 [Schizophyllum commune H4-8]KAI5888068.1 hypothetical protein SCHCODRAFT_01160926 [Schizophyllum commune H4-8]